VEANDRERREIDPHRALFAEVAELRKTLGEGTAEFEKRRNEVRAKHGLQSIDKKD